MIMRWIYAVYEAIQRVCKHKGSKTFTRRELIQQELNQIIADTASKGVTPEQTLSYYLQKLRDKNKISFLDNDGTYQLNT